MENSSSNIMKQCIIILIVYCLETFIFIAKN